MSPDANALWTTEQDLTANEVDSTWYSDATFSHDVGESDLYCNGSKFVHGTIGTRFVARFTWPCNGAGGPSGAVLRVQRAEFLFDRRVPVEPVLNYPGRAR